MFDIVATQQKCDFVAVIFALCASCGIFQIKVPIFYKVGTFPIIFNYGYGAVSVDFACGSDKIIFPYG